MSEEKETFDEVLNELRFDIVHDAGWFYSRLKDAHEREILKYRTQACHDDGRMTEMSLEICELRHALSGIVDSVSRFDENAFSAILESARDILSKEGCVKSEVAK